MKLSLAFREWDEYIYKTIDSYPSTSRRELLPVSFMEQSKKLLGHSQGTRFLRERFLRDNFFVEIADPEVVIETGLRPFGRALETLGIDLGRQLYGPFSLEGAKKIETSLLVHYSAKVNKDYRGGKMTFMRRKLLLREQGRWVAEYTRYYGEPYDRPDNIAAISESFWGMLDLMRINQINYHLRGR